MWQVKFFSLNNTISYTLDLAPYKQEMITTLDLVLRYITGYTLDSDSLFHFSVYSVMVSHPHVHIRKYELGRTSSDVGKLNVCVCVLGTRMWHNMHTLKYMCQILHTFSSLSLSLTLVLILFWSPFFLCYENSLASSHTISRLSLIHI